MNKTIALAPSSKHAKINADSCLRIPRILDVISLMLLLLLMGAALYLVNFRDTAGWVDIIFDDAYYYIGVVRNLIEGHGSRFLPPFQTNGYQPLWLAVLWVLGNIFGTSDKSLVLQVYFLSLACIFLFGLAGRKRYGHYYPAILVSLMFYQVTLCGLETVMIPGLFLAYLGSKNWGAKGALSSAIFLTRLDALSLVLACDLVKLCKRQKIDIRPYFVLAAVAGLYFLLNYVVFKSPVPVSGLIKSISVSQDERHFVGIKYFETHRYIVVLIGMLFAMKFFNKTSFRIKYAEELGATFIAMVICAFYYSLNYGWPLWGWYFWPVFLFSYFVCLEVIHHLTEGVSNRKISVNTLLNTLAVIVLLIGLFPAVYYFETVFVSVLPYAKNLDSFGKENIKLVQFIQKANVRKGAWFAMGDRAGSLGFFLGNDFNFIHTEGLVGPYEYYRALEKNQGKDFIEHLPIDYVVTDRQKYMESGSVLGVIEPVQALATRTGPFVLCFDKSGIVQEIKYSSLGINNTRYLIDFKKQVTCPNVIVNSFNQMRSKYGAISAFSLPDGIQQPMFKKMLSLYHLGVHF